MAHLRASSLCKRPVSSCGHAAGCSRAQRRRNAARAEYPGPTRRISILPIGEEDEDEDQPIELDTGQVVTPPRSMRGLTVNQMLAMGIVGDDVKRVQNGMTEDSLRASYHYVPPEDRVSTQRSPMTMRRGRPGRSGRGPRGAGNAPDLPSLLLDGRIVYIGMPIVPSVAELVVSELLWLQYADREKPVSIYFNTIGSQRNFNAIAHDCDAYTILDTMNITVKHGDHLQYLRQPKTTVAVAECQGNAAMLLAAGTKGRRAALPHARMKVAPPRINREFGQTVNLMISANELQVYNDKHVDYISQYTGRSREQVEKDTGFDKWYSPEAAIEYGLIDQIIEVSPTGDKQAWLRQKKEKAELEEEKRYRARVRRQRGRGDDDEPQVAGA